MLVRGVGIRDISKIEEVSIGKVLTVLAKYCPTGAYTALVYQKGSFP